MEEKLLEEMSVLDVGSLCATVDEGGSEFADRRIAIEASLCPCYRFRKDMRRANLGCCFLWGYVHLILALSVLFNVIAFGITKQRCFLYLGIISALVFGLHTAYFRMRIRRQFNIKLGGGISGVATMPKAAASVVSCSGATAVVSCGSGGGIFTIDEPSVSTSVGSSTFQDCHKPQLMGSTMQIPTFSVSPSPMDWNQTTIRNSGRAGNYSHAMHQDDLSSRPYFEQDTSINYAGDSSSNPFLDTNQSLIQQHNHLSFSNKAGDCSFPLPSTCYYDGRSQNYSSPMSGGYRPTNQLHFSSNTAYWNAPAIAAASEEARPVFYSSMPALGQIFEHNLSSNLTKNLNSEGARELSCSTTKKSSINSTSSEHAFKKTQIVTPTPLPLPTFKVRKEKLGDRITALQQLVAPFGKTDAASVLYEAIGYIKFLHDQVNVLSTPYLKNQHPMQHHQNSDAGGGPNKDLRSRGLCLVPIASTYPVASEIPADFWTPTFGGLMPSRE